MRSHASAIAWELRRRHRWGFVALGAYVAALAVIQLISAATGERVVPQTELSFLLTVVIPGTVAMYWFLTVFTYGQSGDLAARQSIYPARRFTLPVTNDALAAWPMLLGAAATALLWIAVRIIALWPSNLPIDVPFVWPCLLAMVLLAWTQALTWLSYPLSGLRVIVAVICLVVVELGAVIGIELKATEPFMIAMLAPQLPLAYVVARHAVSRARRGDIPDWGGGGGGSGAFDWLARATAMLTGPQAPFASPMRAQTWLEWRRHGRSLPALVAFVLPVELALLWIARDAPALAFMILVIVAVTPPFMASFTAVAARKSSASDSDSYGVSPFIAARPLSSGALVAAKLRMAVWSTTVAWLMVLVATPAALVLSDTWGMMAERARAIAELVGTPRVVVFGLLVLGAFIASTWRQLVQSLYVGLSGRAWLVKGSALVMLCVIVLIGPILDWAWDSTAVRRWMWIVVPWTLAILVLIRMITASWIVGRLYRARLISDGTLVVSAAVWLLAVVAIYAVLVWLVATPLVPRYLLGFGAILAVPLVRVSAAPLALDWNRHR